MLSPGTVLKLANEVWTVIGQLPGATDGFGDLYIVRDERGGEAVAKLVEKDPRADRELLIGAATQAAGYSNVIPVLDHGEHGQLGPLHAMGGYELGGLTWYSRAP